MASSKIFKHHFGMSLGTYIRRKRIEYAAHEIINKNAKSLM
jgi:AraC-like DNA-binding protein